LVVTSSTTAVAAGRSGTSLPGAGRLAASTPAGGGYWLATPGGRVYAFGAARPEGSLTRAPAKPVVGLAGTPDGGGYWLAASDGGVFAFGDARFHGSAGSLHLNAPIVAMAAAPDGGGYWLAASDGGVFAFGDASFHGSGAAMASSSVIGIGAAPDGGGYWLLDATGHVQQFGDAGADGQVAATGSTFSALAALPHPFVSRLAVTPDALGFAGGTVELEATATGATSCSVTASPAIAGFPRTISCGPGAPDVAVTVPPDSGGPRPEELRVVASGAGGLSPPGVVSVSADGDFDERAWPEAPPGTQLEGISCPASGFCVAVDDRANAIVYRGGRWSATSVALGQQLSTVSCVSTTFCLAGGDYGVDTYQNGAWSPPSGPALEDQSLLGLSCVSASFCAGSSANYLYTVRNGHWSETLFHSLDAAEKSSVSCTSATFCAATITPWSTQAQTSFSYWNGIAWSKPGQSTSISAEEISCATPSMCLVSTGGTKLERFDGKSWRSITAPISVQTLACPSASFCVGGNDQGGTAVYDGGSWSRFSGLYGFTALSCASTTFCGAAGYRDATLFDPSRPLVAESSTPAPSSSWGNSFDPVGCAADGYCAAANGPDVIEYDGTSWSSPVALAAPGYVIMDVSCASSSFCAAVDNDGNFYTFDGALWSPPTTIDAASPELRALSCPSSSFCAAVDGSGDALVREGSTWSETALNVSPQGRSGLSCVSASFCMVTYGSDGYEFDGQSWSATPGWTALGPVSCVTPRWCEALAGADVAVWNGAQWSWPSSNGPSSVPTGLSCPSTTTCVAGEPGYLDIERGRDWSTLQGLHGSPPILGFACSSQTECVGVGNDLVTFDPSIWPVAAQVEPSATLDSISCAPTSYCVAADTAGDVFVHGDGSWSGPRQIEDVTGGTFLVSCSSSTSCVAADGLGRYRRYDGISWSLPEYASPGAGAAPFTSLSCPSGSFCGGVQQLGYPVRGWPVVFDGTKWTIYDVSDDVTSVDCVSSTFCLAVDAGGNVLTFDGSSWTGPLTIDPQAAGDAAVVSCTSRTNCVYVNLTYPSFMSYRTYVYDGSSWHRAGSFAPVYPTRIVGFSCGSPSFCAVAVTAGSAFEYWAFDGKQWHGHSPAPGVTGISCAGTTICAATDWLNRIWVGTAAGHSSGRS
jgi:hypothetical protein